MIRLNEVTPKVLRCAIGVCPAIYEIENVTPVEYDCSPLPICPAIYTAQEESYLVIGKTVDARQAGLLEQLSEGQTLIEVPKGLIDKRIG